MDFLNFQNISNEDIFNYLMINAQKIIEIPFNILPNLSNTYYITFLEGDDLEKNNYFGFYPYALDSNSIFNFFPCQYRKVWILFHTFKYNGEILYFNNVDTFYEGRPQINPYKKNSYFLQSADYSFTCEEKSTNFILVIQHTEQLCLLDTEENRKLYASSSDFISSSESYQGDDPFKQYFYCLMHRTTSKNLGNIRSQKTFYNVIGSDFSTFLLKSEQEIIKKMIEIDKYINREGSYQYAKENKWESIQEDTDEGPVNANSFFPYPSRKDIFG